MNPKILTLKQWTSLHACIRKIPDCRKPQEIRHPYYTILTIGIAAVLCGAKSFAAVGEFAAQLTQAQLKHLWAWVDPKTGRYLPPSESTLRRVLQSSDIEALDQHIGQWCLDQGDRKDPIAIDGKTVRGARRDNGTPVQLLSAFLQQQAITVAQVEIAQKSNEIPAIKPLLAPLSIEGRVVTADALHTQKDTVLSLKKKSPLPLHGKRQSKNLRLLRLAGYKNIASELRYMAGNRRHALTFLGVLRF